MVPTPEVFAFPEEHSVAVLAKEVKMCMGNQEGIHSEVGVNDRGSHTQPVVSR